jgi:hypothetical protein
MSGAIATLTDAFADPSTDGGATDHMLPVAVTSWPTVPVEIIRAAGLRPVVIRGDPAATPLADDRLEPGVFPNRVRQLVEAVCAGRLRRTACLVLPRTADADYRTFLYLRELIRQGAAPLRAPILLFDLLQSDGPDVHAYDAARTRDLFAALVAIAQRPAAADDVRDAIARANAARASMRRLLALRHGSPRVSGAEVLPLLGAFWRFAPDEYVALAGAAADVLARRPPLDGPRVMLAGAPVDGPQLHAAIESHGAIVVAEPGPWGSEAAGEDVGPGDDPFAAIAERYRRSAIGPRTPLATVRQRMESLMDDVDAVVVVVPPDDTAFGWDYPCLRAWLEARQLPHLCVFGDPVLPPPPVEHERIAALVAAARQRVGARHG